MAGIVLYAGCSFFTFESLKKLYKDRYGVEPSRIVRVGAGAVAGLIGQTASYPIDVIRRRLQTDAVLGVRYDSVHETFLAVVRNQGLRGLYKGASMNWIKGPISVTVSFNVYEMVHKQLFEKWQHR